MRTDYVNMFQEILGTTLAEDVVDFLYIEKVSVGSGYDPITGNPVNTEIISQGTKGILNSIDKSWASDTNFSPSNLKLWFLQDNLDAIPNTDGQITINGIVYDVLGVRQDFLKACWTLMLRTGGNGI